MIRGGRRTGRRREGREIRRGGVGRRLVKKTGKKKKRKRKRKKKKRKQRDLRRLASD